MQSKKMTRVICTVGPSSNDPEILKKMIADGMNVARLNFSHGSHDSHRAVIKLIRKLAAEMGTYVGILQDLCGPKIRLKTLPEKGVRLISGGEIYLSSEIAEYVDGILPVAYPNLHKDVTVGENILIADGMMALEVKKIEGTKVLCKILTGGVAFSKKGVNMPQSKLTVSAFTEKDKEDLIMGLAEDVEFVALSFVRSADDLKEIRAVLAKHPHPPKLIAKIEKPQAVKNLQEILDVVDGVMVARGDMGVELALERVPMIQKEIIKSARENGKFVITATQMLVSMVSSPRPTRGEASDVANAILDGTDAVMLSDETASGSYPVEACEVLGRIAQYTEPYAKNALAGFDSEDKRPKSVSLAVGRAASWLAHDIGAAAIVAYTQSGFTAQAVAQYRPTCPIFALTPIEKTCRELSMVWGSTAKLCTAHTNTDEMFEDAKKLVVEAGFAKKGDKIVLTAGVPMGKSGSTTLLRVLEIQ